jgi:hypothetical protein
MEDGEKMTDNGLPPVADVVSPLSGVRDFRALVAGIGKLIDGITFCCDQEGM